VRKGVDWPSFIKKGVSAAEGSLCQSGPSCADWPEGAARQDRRTDTGKRFFRRGAHQGGIAERKAMIDPQHGLLW